MLCSGRVVVCFFFCFLFVFFFFKQKTAYEIYQCDWSSDVCSSDLQAYAYLVVPSLKLLSSDVSRRLRLVEEFSHLGSGFDIAMSDLELRGAGNILGRQQHGFVGMIGFDLYCRFLKKEIEYLKGILKKSQIKE